MKATTTLIGAAIMMLSGLAIMGLSAFSQETEDNVQWYVLWVSIRENPNGGEFATSETALVPVKDHGECFDYGTSWTEEKRGAGEITRRYMCVHVDKVR